MYLLYDTAGRSHICNTVDQDELAQCLMILKFIDHDLICQRDLADRNLIFA